MPTTLGELADRRSNDETNNFLVLRLFAASLVIHGHAFAVAAPCASCKDVVERYVGYRYSGDLGLHIFFVISGFLVFASYTNRRSLRSFAIARALRILPALWVCLSFTVIVGALFSSLSLWDFFNSGATWTYLISNGLLYRAEFHLPATTLTHSPQYGAVMNGSIWSLFVEVRLYLLIALAGVMGVVNSRMASNVCLLALFVLGMGWPDHLPFIGEYSENWRLAAFFGVGVGLYVNRVSIPLNGQLACLLVLSSLLTKGTPDFEVVAGACLAYCTFYIAYCRKFRIPKWINDYSYGIYLYGWPIEQLTGHTWPRMGPYKMTATAMCASWLCGFISWHLIEKRAMRLKSIVALVGLAFSSKLSMTKAA